MAPTWCSFYIIIVSDIEKAVDYLKSIDVTIVAVDYDLGEIYTNAQIDSLKLRRLDRYKPLWLKDKIYVGFKDKNNIFW